MAPAPSPSQSFQHRAKLVCRFRLHLASRHLAICCHRPGTEPRQGSPPHSVPRVGGRLLWQIWNRLHLCQATSPPGRDGLGTRPAPAPWDTPCEPPWAAVRAGLSPAAPAGLAWPGGGWDTTLPNPKSGRFFHSSPLGCFGLGSPPRHAALPAPCDLGRTAWLLRPGFTHLEEEAAPRD